MKIKLLVVGLGMFFFNGTVFAEFDSLANYDNFDTREINGCKDCIDRQQWIGFERGDYTTEIRREVKSKRLRITHRSWGGMDSDAGTEQGRNSMRFRDSELLSRVCFTPRIKKYELNSCAANNDPGQVQIRYLGNFYDTDGNDDGDDGVVYAGIALTRNSSSESKASKFSIEAWASQCVGEDCEGLEPWSTSDDIDDPDLSFGTTKASKNKQALCIGYDRANHELVFSYGKDIRIVDAGNHGLPAFANDLTSSQTWHVIETVTDVPNCTARRLTGAVDGDVDDVRTNQHRFAIGDTGPAGGIVFYITDGGAHGLEAAQKIPGNAKWGCTGDDIPGADGWAIGTGAQNTADILAGCGTAGIAARLVDAYTLNGYTDWHLPSVDELKALSQSGVIASRFKRGNYWSSTKHHGFFDQNSAMIVNINTSEALHGGRGDRQFVLPVRQF